MNGEYKEIASVLPKVMKWSDASKIYEDWFQEPDSVKEWLKDNLNIDAKIDVGFFLNPSDNAGSPNVYKRGGKVLSHSQALEECKKIVDEQERSVQVELMEDRYEIYQIKVWKCIKCGYLTNTGKFCSECGSSKSASVNEWNCTSCGNIGNIGKFCANCVKSVSYER